jgi:glycosyltransferase 2 family protein
MISAKTLIKLIINTLIGVILVAVWLQFVNIHEITEAISKVKPVSLIPIFLFMLLSPVIRAFRLQIFLANIQKTSLKDLIYLNGVAMLLNFFIPIRAGELAKGAYLNNRYHIPLAKGIIWIFLDRFLDFLVVVALASVLFFIIPTSLSLTFIIAIAFIFLAFVLLAWLMIYKPDFARKIFKFLSHLLIVKSIKLYFERITNFLLESFTVLKRSPKDLGLLVVITLLAYGADGGIWYFSFLALKEPQSFINMYFAQLLSALTYLIPAAPGYVGSAEASGVLILSGVFGLKTNLASAMVVLFHVLVMVFVLVFGLISVYLLKLNLGEILGKIFKGRKG